LARRPGDPPETVWAICDRGPNLKVKDAIGLYGAEGLEALKEIDGAKLMPRPDLGPEIAELRVSADRVDLVRTLRLRDREGRPVSGLPLPPGPNLLSEPAFDLSGRPLAPDPGGMDTEGIAALPGGGFWVSEEFGPSLVRIDADGRVLRRLVPQGVALEAPYEVAPRLPAIATRRKLNRGFEALALSTGGETLYLAFQSPLAHPDEAAHESARHVRIWELEADNGAFRRQYLYPLDKPSSFRRDVDKGRFTRGDVKISEMLAVDARTLLVLERGSETTKLYRVLLDPKAELPSEHLDPSTTPTLEELSAGPDIPLPDLSKSLLFSTDDAPEVGRDLEGMARLSPTQLLLVSDNDFGVEGATTGFWRLSFEAPVLGGG
jgi:hypothetical protein